MIGKTSLDFWLTSEDLSNPGKRVTIDREGNIVLSNKPNKEEDHKRLTHIDQDETQVTKSDKSQPGARTAILETAFKFLQLFATNN
jgi:hypothetical protein